MANKCAILREVVLFGGMVSASAWTLAKKRSLNLPEKSRGHFRTSSERVSTQVARPEPLRMTDQQSASLRRDVLRPLLCTRMKFFQRKKAVAVEDPLETSPPATSSTRKIFPTGIKLLHSPTNPVDAVVEYVTLYPLPLYRDRLGC